MRQRHRWATEEDFSRSMELQASDALAWLGLKTIQLKALAKEGDKMTVFHLFAH